MSDGGREPSALPLGAVTRTDPAAGSRVSRGFNVTLFTSDGSLATTMPQVVGSPLNKALKDLQAAGFNKDNVTVNVVSSETRRISVSSTAAIRPVARRVPRMTP